MKKRGFGKGRFNGVGGKVEEGKETIEECAIRETKEEINVTVSNLIKVSELEFRFKNNPAWDQMVHVYLTEKWTGEPKESEEVSPKWFMVNEIPFETSMWPDDKFWLPEVLKGNLIKASFVFGDNDVILSKEVNKTDNL